MKHNDAVIYLRGICHEENSIIFKVLSFNVVFNSMDYYNVFHRLYEFTVG